MFYLVDILRTSGLGHSISDNAERLLRKGRGEGRQRGRARICRSFCNKRPGSGNIKRLLLIKENRTSQVNEFSRFSMYGKMQKPGFPEIIPLLCTSALWGQHPVFSHPEPPQGAPLWVGAAVDC